MECSLDPKTVVFSSISDAEKVLLALLEAAKRFNAATVQDFLDLSCLPGHYTYMSFGWSPLLLRAVTIKTVTDGYILDLSKPRPLSVEPEDHIVLSEN